MMKTLSRLLLSFLVVILAGCQLFPQAWTDEKSSIWWQDATFYEIFVRSFQDSDGDGIGDFKGLISKLDYLNDGNPATHTDLGVTGIWLMPVTASPSYHGYDVTDYYNVNSQCGTLEDFKTLLAEAHKRGIKVIIDLVINHTSTQHPWFQAANNGDPAFRDWYIWSDENPGYKGPWNEEVWHMGKEGYYYGVFVESMPDLNYRNPAVVEEMRKVATFWLKDVGVDGFRVDGDKHVIEDWKTQENTEATHAFLKDFTAFIHEQAPEALVVGEIWSGLEAIAPYVNENDLDLAFNFPLADNFLKTASGKNSFQVVTGLANSKRLFQAGKLYASFLTNHDQPRTMTVLMDTSLKAKTAATLLLTSPGVPFIFYGEEIGMLGPKPDESIRRPMQWNGEKNAGFTPDLPWMLVNEDYKEKNVDLLSQDPSSLLNHYRSLIVIRSNHYALRTGQYVEVSTGNNALFAILRTAEKESILVLVNLSDQPVTDIRLNWNSSALRGSYRSTVLMGPKNVKVNGLKSDDKGGSKDYQPVSELAAGQTLIIQFRP